MAGPETPPSPGQVRDPAASTSSALLDALFANATIGIAHWDAEVRFRRINSELAALNGVPVETHIGRRPSEILPEMGHRLEGMLEQVLRSGVILRAVEIAGQTPAAPGITRHWVADYFPVRDGGGATIGVVGLVAEVTGERQAEFRADEALRRSAFVDAELQALYAALPVGVAFLNPELRYRRVNETLARMNGQSLDYHVGRSPEEVLGPQARDLKPALQKVLESREPLEIQVEREAPGAAGESRTYEATYFPVVDGQSELLGVGGVVRDVTERRALEAEQSRLLRDAMVARAQAEAAQVRADSAREEAERARAESEAARVRATLLARAGRAMAESLDYRSTLRTVAHSAVPALADWAALNVVEPDGRLRVLAVAHRDPDREDLAWALADRHALDLHGPSTIARVIRNGEMEVGSDLPIEALHSRLGDTEQLRMLANVEPRHFVSTPLKTPQGVVGALTLVRGDPDWSFSPEDIQFMTSLASRAALHISHARMYTERTHIARTLQASLRPRALPEIPGAELAARFLAAGEENDVGGDFYDVFVSGDGVWTLIVGDVSGKGPEAAAITSLARHTLRTASMLHDDPAANLALLNRALYANSLARDFCTVLYARVCPGDEGLDLRFSNGGHPSPLLLRPDGTVESVDTGRGPLVGGVGEAEFSEGTLRLRPGELLLVYTDGVTEVRTDDVDLGARELRATLAAHAGAAAQDIVEAVERRAVELQGGAPRDDIAVIAIRAADGRGPAVP